MPHLLHNIRDVMQIIRDTKGATAIEYGLIAALISVAIITAATTLGTNIGYLSMYPSIKF